MSPDSPADAFVNALMRPTLVFDIDGVLAFCLEAVITGINAHFGTSLLVEEIKTYWLETTLPQEQFVWVNEQKDSPVFLSNIAPDYSAISACAALHLAGFDIVIASDRAASCAEATEGWLDRWQIPYDTLWLHGPGSKEQLAAKFNPEHPMILIDDNPSKWLTVTRPGVQVWAPMRTWTPPTHDQYPNVQVFNDWTEVLSLLGVTSQQSV